MVISKGDDVKKLQLGLKLKKWIASEKKAHFILEIQPLNLGDCESYGKNMILDQWIFGSTSLPEFPVEL